MHRKIVLSVLLVCVSCLIRQCKAEDWPRFLGPGADGSSPDTNLPTTWSAEEGIAWKTPLPGAGGSSPIVIGDKVLLTAYSGYGLNQDDPGSVENLMLHVVCIDKNTGKLLWDKSAKARQPETKYSGFLALHGYASNTPVTDGERVYAFFGASGVYALSLDGEFLWLADVGSGIHGWGSGASPILFEDLVIVSASIESESIVALNKETGKEVWRTEGIKRAWGTPLVVDVPGGSPELVVSMEDKVLALDPKTGKQLWEEEGVHDYICPSVIAHEGIVYITAGRSPMTLALRCGKTDSPRKLWDLKKTSKVPTPVLHEGHLYWVDVKGIAACVNAKSGEVVYQERIRLKGAGDKVYASPIYADGKIYVVSRADGTLVLAASPEFEQLAHNPPLDDSIFNATPAIVDGKIFIRGDRFLYCLGKK
jgi:outer membrane protein assembly factor BamB